MGSDSVPSSVPHAFRSQLSSSADLTIAILLIITGQLLVFYSIIIVQIVEFSGVQNKKDLYWKGFWLRDAFIS